jgi:peroxiredoxin (alkyl hydroperoxide reductase subunit C)
MSLHLGDVAPDFAADTQLGELAFHDWKGDAWAILFSHPADFTPVCTTEMGRFAELEDEFTKRGVKLIGLSVDTVEEHHKWIPEIEKFKGGIKLNYPIIADAEKKVSLLYDMIHPAQGDSSSVRSVFVIDGAHKIRLMMIYPKSTGRNFDELIRVVDALQKADSDACATGADWRPGDKIIVPPTVPTAQAREQFADVDEIYPYLRFASGRK